MAAPLAPIIKTVLAQAGRSAAATVAADKEKRNKLAMALSAIIIAAMAMMAAMVIMIMGLSSTAMGFGGGMKNLFAADAAIEAGVDDFIAGLDDDGYDMLYGHVARLREWMVDEGHIDGGGGGGPSGGHAHQRLDPETVSAIISRGHDPFAKGLLAWAADKVGGTYSQAQRMADGSFDCSSFVYRAYLDRGIDISHGGMTTAAAIARGLDDAGKTFTDRGNLMPGDLVFTSTAINGRYRNITHVVLYVGGGMVIDARSANAGVTYRALPNHGPSFVFCARPRQ